MFQHLFGQRKYLAAITAAIVIIQMALPGGLTPLPPVEKVFAADSVKTWEFDSGGDYTLDGSLSLFDYDGSTDGVLQNIVNSFSTDGFGGVLPAGSFTKLMRTSTGRIWGTLNSGVALYSDDAGSNWTVSVDATLTAMTVKEIITAGADHLVAVGSSGGLPTSSYSSDDGATWNPSVGPIGVGATEYLAGTYDSANDKVYIVDEDGGVKVTANDGMVFTDVRPVHPVDSVNVANDIVSFGSDKVAIIGNTGGGVAKVSFTTNAGTDWSNASFPSLPGSNDFIIGSYVNGYLYIGAVNYLTRNNITGGGTLDDSTDWTSVAGNLNGGTINTISTIFGGINSNQLFITIKTASGYRLYSSLNNGSHWLLNATEAVSDSQTGEALWNSDGTKMIWSGTNGGVGDVWVSAPNPLTTSAIITNGIVGVARLTAISATYHAYNFGEVYVSFSNTSVDGGTWYYYSGGAWLNSTQDSITRATDLATLTGEVLATLPITGDIYVKLYPSSGTSAMVVLDQLQITYAINSGDGGDKTPPSSQVNSLPEFSTSTNLCNPVLNVSATANDANGSVSQVELFISTDGENFVSWGGTGNPDKSAPYTWKVPVENNTTYYFYSIATDFAKNKEEPPTNPNWDATTTIDVTPPHIEYSTPASWGESDISINLPIIVGFSEPMSPDSFVATLYKESNPDNPVQGLTYSWGNGNQEVTISHPPLEYLTKYIITVSGRDRATNELVVVPPRCGSMGIQIVYQDTTWSFTTQPKIDPDLIDSTLTVADGPNGDGSYHPGDNAQFTLTLVNKSTVSANNVLARFPVADGLSYVRTDDNGGGTMQEIKQNGKTIALEWRNINPIIMGTPVVVKLTMKIDSPALLFSITQEVKIYDYITYTEIPDQPLVRSAVVTVAHNSNFDASTKTVNKANAQPGDVLTYTVTIVNNGTTSADAQISDSVPNEANIGGLPKIFYKPGSLTWNQNDTRWATAPYYDNATQTIIARANGLQPSGGTISFTFQATIRGASYFILDETVINTAEIWDPNIDPITKVNVSASTTVPGSSDPNTTPLTISYQSPAPNSFNNGFKQSIKTGFNKSIVIDNPAKPFVYELYEDGAQLSAEELEEWNPTWSKFNEKDNTMFTLTPPTGKLLVGAVYTVTIVSATDVTGKTLSGAPVTWEFTTADPMVQITSPTDSLYELLKDTLSDPFTVQLTDSISGLPYVAEDNVMIGMRSYLNGKIRASGTFWTANGHQLDSQSPRIVITKGTSVGEFFYKDSVASTPDYLTIRAFDDEFPPLGWIDDEKYVEVVDTIQPAEDLRIEIPESITVNEFSPAILVTAANANGSPKFLPQGRLYLYTDSASGGFYDSRYRKLPELNSGLDNDVTVLGLEPQYIDINGNVAFLTLYYLSNDLGIEELLVSDNNPQIPDTGLNDAAAIISVKELIIEEELEKELEEIEDDTGRVVDRLELEPTDIKILPGGKQDFKVTAFDEDGEEINGLKYKWFVLIDKSGQIEKNGHKGSSISTFTAGSKLGTYYDDVLVATLYNGKLAYATATVKIVDVVNYKGPKRLPVTGVNGLQLVLMSLTLMAAVALAWVEHYDKTHFRQDSH